MLINLFDTVPQLILSPITYAINYQSFTRWINFDYYNYSTTYNTLWCNVQLEGIVGVYVAIAMDWGIINIVQIIINP